MESREFTPHGVVQRTLDVTRHDGVPFASIPTLDGHPGTVEARAARDRRSTAAIAALCCALFVSSSLLPNVGLLDESQVGDTPLYRSYGEAVLDGRFPYRDYSVEYPPGALPLFVVPALGNGDYATRFKLLACALGAAATAFVVLTAAAAGWNGRRMFLGGCVAGLAPAALGPVYLVNYDIGPAMLTAAAVWALVSGRERLAAVALGVAVAAKLYPIVLLPIVLVAIGTRSGRKRAVRAGAAFVATVTAVVMPFLTFGAGGLATDAWNTVRRPLQIESLGASILLAAHQLSFYEPHVDSRFNSQNISGPLAATFAAVIGTIGALLLVACYVRFLATDRRTDAVLTACAAAVCTTVAFGKVLSPQYLVWLVPLVALVARTAWTRTVALLALALVLTQSWFPDRYGEVVALRGAGWLVLARDVSLVALAMVLIAAVRPASSATR